MKAYETSAKIDSPEERLRQRAKSVIIAIERKRAIAYSMDLLIPGLYLWMGRFTIRLFGSTPDDEPYKYPGTLNNNYGIALILPGWTTSNLFRCTQFFLDDSAQCFFI
jgi:hypothetical protein